MCPSFIHHPCLPSLAYPLSHSAYVDNYQWQDSGMPQSLSTLKMSKQMPSRTCSELSKLTRTLEFLPWSSSSLLSQSLFHQDSVSLSVKWTWCVFPKHQSFRCDLQHFCHTHHLHNPVVIILLLKSMLYCCCCYLISKGNYISLQYG